MKYLFPSLLLCCATLLAIDLAVVNGLPAEQTTSQGQVEERASNAPEERNIRQAFKDFCRRLGFRRRKKDKSAKKDHKPGKGSQPVDDRPADAPVYGVLEDHPEETSRPSEEVEVTALGTCHPTVKRLGQFTAVPLRFPEDHEIIGNEDCGEWTDKCKPPPWTVLIRHSLGFIIGAAITLQHLITYRGIPLRNYPNDYLVFLADKSVMPAHYTTEYWTVKRVFYHSPKYDLAILELSEPLKPLTTKQLVCLPPFNDFGHLSASTMEDINVPIFQKHEDKELDFKGLKCNYLSDINGRVTEVKIQPKIPSDKPTIHSITAHFEPRAKEIPIMTEESRILTVPATFTHESDRHHLVGFLNPMEISGNPAEIHTVNFLSDHLWQAKDFIKSSIKCPLQRSKEEDTQLEIWKSSGTEDCGLYSFENFNQPSWTTYINWKDKIILVGILVTSEHVLLDKSQLTCEATIKFDNVKDYSVVFPGMLGSMRYSGSKVKKIYEHDTTAFLLLNFNERVKSHTAVPVCLPTKKYNVAVCDQLFIPFYDTNPYMRRPKDPKELKTFTMEATVYDIYGKKLTVITDGSIRYKMAEYGPITRKNKADRHFLAATPTDWINMSAKGEEGFAELHIDDNNLADVIEWVQKLLSEEKDKGKVEETKTV